MCKIFLICMISSLQSSVFLTSCSWAINFVNVCSQDKLYATKLWFSHIKFSFWMRQEYSWCTSKPSSSKFMNGKWNYIHSHSLMHHVLFTVSGIRSWMCLTVKYYWISYSILVKLFLSLTIPTINILFIAKLFLGILDIFWWWII